MSFKRFSQTAAILLAFCAAIKAGPVVNTFDTTNNYNFQLGNGGGGIQAELNSAPVETFCVDFDNEIYLNQDYTANLTTLTQGSSLTDTRFGSVTNWTTIGNQGVLTMAGEINTATDLGRYQMAAYLISEYNMSDGANTPFSVGGNATSDNGIQQAIWDILDPKGETFPSIASSAYADSALESAASWYYSTDGNTGSTARNTFLANFRIVSDTSLTGVCAGALVGCGFQEQITVVPEPRYLALMLVGLLILGSALYRRFTRTSRTNA